MARKLNEDNFAEAVKRLTTGAELIRTRQEEKQSAVDEFRRSKERYSAGRISKSAFNVILERNNTELRRLDREINLNVSTSMNILKQLKNSVANQSAEKILGMSDLERTAARRTARRATARRPARTTARTTTRRAARRPARTTARTTTKRRTAKTSARKSSRTSSRARKK